MVELIRQRSAGELVERGQLLGLAVSRVGEVSDVSQPVRFTRRRAIDAAANYESGLVVDLSALWAGPLCGRLLAEAGYRVVKVETPDRPDGARAGVPKFFESMNSNKEQLTMRLDSPELRELLDRAEIVIEASRPVCPGPVRTRPRTQHRSDLAVDHRIRPRSTDARGVW